MSGVIDENGVQWEHCAVCGEFVRIEDLLYEPPSVRFKYGRDIGPCCWDLSPEQQDEIADRKKRRWVVVSMLAKELAGEKPTLHLSGGISSEPDPDQPKIRWVREGNSSRVHPDDAHLMQQMLDRTRESSRRARDIVDQMTQEEIDEAYELRLAAAEA